MPSLIFFYLLQINAIGTWIHQFKIQIVNGTDITDS